MTGRRLRVVIAPDSFKGTADAEHVARAIGTGWSAVRPGDDVLLAPMADGGEGTVDAFAAAVPAARRMPVMVQGPDGRPVDAHWLLLPDGAGVVELASTSGLTLLDRPRGLDAHTIGFGEAVLAALRHPVERLILGIGGSASTDGGTGLLTALGARFLAADGDPIEPGARGLARLGAVELAALAPPPPGGAVVVTDVTSPLLGPAGAAATFGPQKGLGPDDIRTVEAGLARLAALLPDLDPATPGSGAAGGTGFGLLAWGARLDPGARAIARAIGLPDLVRGADLVISGEGRYDAQSASGKAPSHVLRLASEAGVPGCLVAGQMEVEPAGWQASVSLVDLAGSDRAAMTEPLRWLREAGARLAAAHS